MDRRDFFRISGAGAIGLFAAPTMLRAAAPYSDPPAWLQGYNELYRKDPRKANLEWFRDAKFGLFMHYGLYSLLGRHEWVQFREQIPVPEYAKLKDRFTARNFDADFITDLALEAEMNYVNITTRHHDSFCLFDTKQTDFNSVDSPAKRDLVGELTEQCQKKGLGIFYYYSHGRDWKHPHAPNNDKYGNTARPHYEHPEQYYATGEEHDLQKYVAFVREQIKELLTNYGPISGIWLDGISTPKAGDVSAFHCEELYRMIHDMQPQVLVSYKQGLLGTEDFFAPERNWKGETDKPVEICHTLQPHAWGYTKADDGKHRKPDEVMQILGDRLKKGRNLLLNTGPLPDGSIHPEDVKTLREVGRRIRATGWPGIA